VGGHTSWNPGQLLLQLLELLIGSCRSAKVLLGNLVLFMHFELYYLELELQAMGQLLLPLRDLLAYVLSRREVLGEHRGLLLPLQIRDRLAEQIGAGRCRDLPRLTTRGLCEWGAMMRGCGS